MNRREPNGRHADTVGGYYTDVVNVSCLDEATQQHIVELYLNHYDKSCKARVLSDLVGKHQVLLLYQAGALVGFTTIQVYSHDWLGHLVNVVFSGDTVVDRRHWGQQALAFRWIKHLGQIKAGQPDTPLYWFLIVKGHRTFRYLPAFSKSFYPHWAMDRSDLKPLADALATAKYAEAYDASTGVIRFSESRGQLKKDIAYPTEEELKKPEVRFFLERNPGYLEGHELVCICEVEESNMKPLTRRIFRKAYDDRVLAGAD